MGGAEEQGNDEWVEYRDRLKVLHKQAIDGVDLYNTMPEVAMGLLQLGIDILDNCRIDET